MSVVLLSQITGNAAVCATDCSGQRQRKISNLRTRESTSGWWICPHKEQVLRKTFPCPEIIMTTFRAMRCSLSQFCSNEEAQCPLNYFIARVLIKEIYWSLLMWFNTAYSLLNQIKRLQYIALQLTQWNNLNGWVGVSIDYISIGLNAKSATHTFHLQGQIDAFHDILTVTLDNNVTRLAPENCQMLTKCCFKDEDNGVLSTSFFTACVTWMQ